MKLLIATALLGMLALAAAADIQPQKKHHKDDDDYHGGHDGGEHEHHNYVEVKYKEWEWEERVGKTYPCAPEYEILGSTVTQYSTLVDDKKDVGSISWTGIVAWHDIDHDSKDYKAAEHHNVKVNYEVIFEVKGKGQIIGLVVGDSIFATIAPPVAVVGGTGAYKGAKGTVTWTYGSPNTYKFKIWLPKGHGGGKGGDHDGDDDDEKDGDYKHKY